MTSEKEEGVGAELQIPSLEESEARFKASSQRSSRVTDEDWAQVCSGLRSATDDHATQITIYPPRRVWSDSDSESHDGDLSRGPRHDQARVAWSKDMNPVMAWMDEVERRLEAQGYRVSRGRKYGPRLIVRGWRERAEGEAARRPRPPTL